MTDRLLIDDEHPWPWLEAFPESAARFFNGRNEDTEALLRCVLAAPVTVLFGKSGLGKSSILQAGLFPSLRAERLFPVYVRLIHEGGSASEQIARRLEEEIRQTQTECTVSNRLTYRCRQTPIQHSAETLTPTNSLWIELHRVDIELGDADGRRWQPVFVLDQFEEIFTLGAQDQLRQKQVFYELGDLLENRIPKTLAERLNIDDELFDRLNLDIQHYRFLVSLREDYLPDLEEWTDLIPRLGVNRFRLLPMSASKAIAAVEKTGGPLVSHEDAENIVHYLSETRNAPELGSHRRRGPGQVEPALLSLMCSGLNDQRIRAKQTRLATNNLAKEGGLIVERFYDTAFADLPESVHDFVEQHLITADGVRLAYPARSAETEKLATAEQINTLVDKRLIRRESLEVGDRIELVHDRLAQVALQHRQDSQQRQQALRQQKRRLHWWIGTAMLMLLLAVFAGYLFNAKTKAQRAWIAATATRLALEGSAITSGLRQGKTITGLFKLVAGHRLSRLANINEILQDEVLQSEYLRFSRLVFLRETPSIVTSVTFSPDGRIIVSGSDDKTLRLWNAKTGQDIGQPLKGHEGWISSIAFSPDGKRIVSGSWDHTLRLWDTNTGQPIGPPLKGHDKEVSSVAFSPDGNRIVSGSRDKTLRLWDTNTSQPIGQPLEGHEAWVNSVAFSPDGGRIVSGSRDKTLRLWDANTSHAIGQPLEGHTDWISSVAFSPDGKRIVSGSWDDTLRLWDANTGQPIGLPLKGHADWVNSVAFSPDGSRLVSGSRDKTLRLWDANTGQPIGLALEGHVSPIISVAFSPDGKHVVSGGFDNSLRLWDANASHPFIQSTEAPTSPIYSVAFSPDGHRIATGEDKTLRLWDANTGQPVGEPLEGHLGSIYSVAFNPDGSRIVSGSADKTLRLWDAKTGKPIGQPLIGHEDRVTSIAFSPNGRRIVSGSGDKTLRLWDANSGQAIGQPLKGHEEWVNGVAFSPDGGRIVSGSGDNTLRLWSANTGQPIGQPLKGHNKKVTSVAFSSDGNRIVSGSLDNTLRLWDAKTGQPINQPLTGHEDWVSSVAFSPDGSRIVSGSGDNTLRLWDTDTGQSIGLPLKGHEDVVFSVAFSPDGNHIVSGSKDKTIRLWPVSESWANDLCKKLGRNMSHQEWRNWVSTEIEYIEQCPSLPVPPDEREAGFIADQQNQP